MAARFSQLRELARQFSAGQVGRDEYRRLRGELLDQIGLRKVAIDYREITPPKPAAPPTVIIDVGEDEPADHRFAIIGIAVAVVLAIAGGAWHYLRQQTAAPAPLVNVAPKAAGIAAVDDFLAAKDWTSAGIAVFEQRWAELDPALQAEARNAPSFGLLEATLRARIEDQLSIMSLDQTGATAAEVARLREFGNRLGVPVP